MKTDLVIVDTGVANMASLQRAFLRIGVVARQARTPAQLAGASHIVLPGVGDFAAGMGRLSQSGLGEGVRHGIVNGTPTLAICLGMQMLCSGSDEAPGIPGLGVIADQCRGLPGGVPIPNLGWSEVGRVQGTGGRGGGPGGVAGHTPSDAGSGAPSQDPRALVTTGFASFANSFALFTAPSGWKCSWTVYGGPFVSAVERGRTLACQFHPELSGTWGLELLDRWLRGDTVLDVSAEADLAHNQEFGAGRSEARWSKRWLAGTGTCRILPCLDVADGRVVKGVHFQNTRDAGDPAQMAAAYQIQGADEIVLLDISAAPDGMNTRIETVRKVRAALDIPLTIGGGVRSVEDGRRLLDAGADRIGINTAAVRDPSLLTRLAKAFGRQCVTLAIDARRKSGSWEVLTVGGRETPGLDAVEWAREGEKRGAGEILLTSWDRDGTRLGADTALIAAVADSVHIPVVASGGIGRPEDAKDAVVAGASAVLAASIFHDGDLEVADIKDYLRQNGVAMRP